MRRITLLGIAALVALSAAMGCSKRAAPLPQKAPEGESAASAPEKSPDPSTHGKRKLAQIDTPVYVDGAQVGVLRFGELPRIEPRVVAGDARGLPRAYSLADYVTALGVDLAKVRAVHVLGNRDRVASIEGSELRAQRDRFLFDFMEREAGIAKTRWDTTGLRNVYRVDEIRVVHVFVNKDAYAVDAKRSCYADASGECRGSLAEAPIKGTRIYLDDKLVAFVKRKQIGASVAVEGSLGARFSLGKYLASVGAAGAQVDLVSGDRVVGRAVGDAWKTGDAVTFSLPAHGHGRVVVSVPGALQSAPERAPERHTENASSRDADVTAVRVYSREIAPRRALEEIQDQDPAGDPADEG